MNILQVSKEIITDLRESYPITCINKKKYLLIPNRESRRWGLKGNIILENISEKLYVVDSSTEIYNVLLLHIEQELNKHPYWTKWAKNLEELKYIKEIKLNNTVDLEVFDDGFNDIYHAINNITELKNLIVKNHQIIKLYVNPTKMTTNLRFEYYLDKIYQVIHEHKAKKFANSFFSNKHKFLINDIVIQKFDYIKDLMDKKKIDKASISNYITKKINKIKTSKEMIILIDKFIEDITGYSLANKIKELENENVEISYNESNLLIAEIDTFEKMSKFGSPQWCIAQSEHYFKQYLSQHKEINRQFILWDFSRKPDDPFSMIGFTINLKDEIKASHLKNDVVTPIEYRETIKNKIPKISEDIKFNIILEMSSIKEDVLMNSIKYNSQKGIEMAKKEIKYRSTSEDKVSILVVYARDINAKNKSGVLFNDESKKIIERFVDGIGLDLKTLTNGDVKRLVKSNNRFLVDLIYNQHKEYVTQLLMNELYTDSSFFKFAYDGFLYKERLNKNIKQEIIKNFEILKNIKIETIKSFSKEELSDLLGTIINKNIARENNIIVKYGQKKKLLNLGVDSAIKKTIEHEKSKTINKDATYYRLENVFTFAENYGLKITNNIKDIMILAIKLNIEKDVETLLIKNDYKKVILKEKDIDNIKLMQHNKVKFISKINNLETMGWITSKTNQRILKE